MDSLDRPVATSSAAEELVARWRRRAQEMEARIQALQQENQALRELAFRDPLTDLDNRRHFWNHLDYALQFMARHGGAVSLLVADLDGMKRLNDTAGHLAGDEVLVRFARLLQTSLRRTDLAARLGGDEFAVVMPRTNAAQAAIVGERIRRRAEELSPHRSVAVTASLGLACLQPEAAQEATADQLFAAADAALYEAKHGGRNRVVVRGVRGREAA